MNEVQQFEEIGQNWGCWYLARHLPEWGEVQMKEPLEAAD